MASSAMDDLTLHGADTTAASLAQALKQRLLDGHPASWISSNVVVLASESSAPSTSDPHAQVRAAIEDWASLEYPRQLSLEPSVPALAARALFHLRRAGRDQAIVLHGNAQASTTSRLDTARTLVALARAPRGKKGYKLASQVAAAELVHRTLLSASHGDRAVSYLELQFNASTRLVGYKALDTGIDASILALPRPRFARTFDLLHALVAGADETERTHLNLPPVNSVSAGHLNLVPSVDVASDAPLFEAFKRSLAKLNFPRKAMAGLLELLAALIHLAQVDFEDVPGDSTHTAIVSHATRPSLLHLPPLLGISDADTLEAALVQRLGRVGADTATVFLDPDGARSARDSLSCALYVALVSNITDSINSRLTRDDFDHLVAIVSAPCILPADARRNRTQYLNLFAANIASERLHAYSLQSLLDPAQRPDINDTPTPLPPSLNPTLPAFEPSPTLRVLTHRPGGLVHIIEDQSKRRAKTDNSMLDAMAKRWGHHSSFSCRASADQSRSSSFSLSHWQADVAYSVEGFLEQNSRAGCLPDDWLQMLGGTLPASAGASATAAELVGGSKNSFVKQILAEDALNIAKRSFTDKKENPAALMANASLSRTPSTRKNKKAAEAEANSKENLVPGKPGLVGVVDKFIDLVIESFTDADFSHVFCLSPNDLDLDVTDRSSQRYSTQLHIDPKFLKTQISNFELDRVVARQQGRPFVFMEHAQFWGRYVDVPEEIPELAGVKSAAQSLVWRDKSLACQTSIQNTSHAEIELRKQAGLATTAQPISLTVGNENVYMDYYTFRRLEDALRSRDEAEGRHIRERLRIGAPYHIDSSNARQSVLNQPTEEEVDPFDELFFSSGRTGPFSIHEGDETDGLGNASTPRLPLVSHSGPNPSGSPFEYGDEGKGGYGEDDDERMAFNQTFGNQYDDAKSIARSDNYNNVFKVYDRSANPGSVPETPNNTKRETAEEVHVSKQRKRWVGLVWALTWWVPGFLLGLIGRMKRKDVRMAWREKLAINMMIWFMCAVSIFIFAVLSPLICPTQHVYTLGELQSHSSSNSDGQVYTAIRGEVFDLGNFVNVHPPSIIPSKNVLKYGGQDATNIFPIQVNALCSGADGSGTVSPYITLDSTNSSDDAVASYHDFRASTNDVRPDWYYESMILLRSNYRRGFMGYTTKDVSSRTSKTDTRNTFILYDGVYDITQYVINGNGGVITAPNGTRAPDNTDRAFLNSNVVQLITSNSGQDITKRFEALNMDSSLKEAQRVCLRNIFYIGKVDTRNSTQCQFARWILLAMSIVVIAIIGFKFLAAISFSRKRHPEDFDRFVICQVPCYTEGEESLRKALESVASTRYDDKRKLLFVICDGMIVGSGNDRPTPRIVLDILGCDPSLDPEPLSFNSVGEGAKQHNMAKIYSGLYEHAGHIVPYIVFVKVGKPTETSRPGNRGKRDSQLVLMRFLSRVHFDSPMAPAELEMYHQIKNVIGVNPAFYEFLLSIDADTEVDNLSLNMLVANMLRDRKIIGLCGETSLANAKHSFVTMLQVYEYFISHHLSKAFESLFGSVTCLPGCFTLFRIRTLEHKPLFASDRLVEDFGAANVHTLHGKNLLHLGEDRYLTTLLLKTFPDHKTTFCKDAFAKTFAPEQWSVLLSQRRRWINSTVHNLAELLGVDKLCGFCLFSMRFMVFVDLFATILQPVTVFYVAYLIYRVAGGDAGGDGSDFPLTALIMLAAIYGLQALIFIFHRKFEHIGWMIIYILGIPLFSLIIPLYSFWHMDDFGWGSTRVVMGEKGKTLLIHDEGEFDPASIPLRTWESYEQELWERGSNASIGSIIAAGQRAMESREGSIYGHESIFDPRRSMMPMPQYAASEFGGASQHSAGRRSVVPSVHLNAPNSVPSRASAFMSQPMPPAGFSQEMFSQYGGENIPLQDAPQFPRSGSFSSSVGLQNLQAPMVPDVTSPVSPSPTGFVPSDPQIVQDIESILNDENMDWNTLSKRRIRDMLEKKYGAPLGDRAQFVNEQVERMVMTH